MGVSLEEEAGFSFLVVARGVARPLRAVWSAAGVAERLEGGVLTFLTGFLETGVLLFGGVAGDNLYFSEAFFELRAAF